MANKRWRLAKVLGILVIVFVVWRFWPKLPLPMDMLTRHFSTSILCTNEGFEGLSLVNLEDHSVTVNPIKSSFTGRIDCLDGPVAGTYAISASGRLYLGTVENGKPEPPALIKMSGKIGKSIALSPDGKRILFVKQDALYIMDIASKTFQKISKDVLDLGVAWAPSGVFVSCLVPGNLQEPNLVEVFSLDTKIKAPACGKPTIGQPFFSEDGKTLIWMDETYEYPHQFCFMDLGTGIVRKQHLAGWPIAFLKDNLRLYFNVLDPDTPTLARVSIGERAKKLKNDWLAINMAPGPHDHSICVTMQGHEAPAALVLLGNADYAPTPSYGR